VLAGIAHRGLPDDPLLCSVLRLGAYQLLFLRVPARAAVHETVALATAHRRGFANALMRKLAGMVVARAPDPLLPRTEVPLHPDRTLVLPEPGLPPEGGTPDPLAVRHSLPDFLVARWRAQHGDAAAAQIALAASAVPVLFLRACANAGDGAALQARLSAEGVQCEATDHPLLLRWTGGAVPFHTGAFAEGWFVVQDPTAVAAAEAVAAAPGMTVVDLCAAPGTKTALLAERVRPDGVVLAWDVDPVRRQRIAENAARLQLGASIRVLDDAELRPGVASAVLADVPCSNTGVLSKRVEVRRRLEPGTFAELAQAQRVILERALEVCRPGGTVVYSTCSIEPEENEQVVAAVVPGRALVVRQQLTLPVAAMRDGGWFAVLQRR
jgi:16S rRNA (cytosine967-C5)-methyltransferase